MLARYYLLGAACAMALCGCGSSSYTSQYGSTSAASSSGTSASGSTLTPGGFSGEASSANGSHDAVVATPPSSLVSVEVGTTKTVPVTLTSNDGRTITGFALSNATGQVLPSGWSAPAAFGCRALSTGSGCVLNLTYSPTMYEVPQTLTLHYVYVDNALEPVTTDSLTLSFQATTSDNVTPLLAPAGQIAATIGAGAQTVTATFTTDDTHPASALTVTSDPSALPPGWTAPAPSSCATVSAVGAACVLTWTYTPTAPDNGTIVIDYSFNDDSGNAKTASFNIPYAATANDNVLNAASPQTLSGVRAGTTESTTVTFTTDDGFQATNLSVDFTTLPADWTASANPFTCGTVSTGTTCQLGFNYSPPIGANEQGTSQLTYTYLDNAGVAKQGTINIDYSSANDDVINAASPQSLSGVRGGTTQSTTVTFTTDDGSQATNLSVDFTSLPADWTASANPFTCGTVSTGTTCQLGLNYSPPVGATEQNFLQLTYTYRDVSGAAKQGTIGIYYSTAGEVYNVASPQTLPNVRGGTTQSTTVTFDTDDGSQATNLSVDLTSLPADWTASAVPFTCSTISTGSACQLGLNYSPAMGSHEQGTLQLAYTYLDASGVARQGQINILYSST
jgi:hypothetical protein